MFNNNNSYLKYQRERERERERESIGTKIKLHFGPFFVARIFFKWSVSNIFNIHTSMI